jgi:hypothetical protein
MATKLILYPQSFDGLSSFYSANSNELIVDGFNFTTLASTSTYTSVFPINNPATILTFAPATVPNVWYRARYGNTATPDFAYTQNNRAVLNSNVTVFGFSVNAMYQKITGLTTGQTYTISVNVNAAVSGELLISAGVSSIVNITTINAGTQIPVSFTATSSEETIIIWYRNTQDNDLFINFISCVETTQSTAIEVTKGQVICDLYENENIPLTLSVDDFKNAAEKVQSYSKAFDLPATKRNNQIFENLFDVTRSAQGNLTFNPYAKTQCELKQDGFILFEGYLRVVDIQDKKGEISYSVNLYSEVIALADILGDKTLSLLDFSELDHEYNITNIKASWNDSGAGITYLNASSSGYRDANDTVKYPFCDWVHNYIIDAASNPVLPNLESSFRPFIQIKYLLDRIFQPTPFNYTSDFFNTSDFAKLYMDFNWGDSETPRTFLDTGGLTKVGDFNFTGSFTTVTWQTLDQIPAAPLGNPGAALSSNFNYSSGVFTAVADGQRYTITGSVEVKAVILAAQFQIEWVHSYSGGEDIYAQYITPAAVISHNYSFSFTVGNPAMRTMVTGDTIFCRAKEIVNNARIESAASGLIANYPTIINVQTNVNQTTTDSLLQNLRGEINQWEFLKGIMTMFNLISVPDKTNPNNILIEPYNDIFINNADSKQLDWTSKVDASEIKLTPLTDLKKKTVFKFVEDDDDYMFNNYKKAVNGFLYGSQIFDATTTTGGFQSVLSGEEEIVAEPFAATVPKPLMTQYADFIIPSIYSYNADDGTSEAFENSPRIMYNNGVKTLTSCTYRIPAQNTVAAIAAETEFLQFSHLSTIPTVVSVPPLPTDTQDFHFGVCQLVGTGQPTANNLFNVYWLPYYNELYNPDTRILSIKINLKAGDINTFRFYDTIFIKNREYRVNKIDYKPNELATVELILIP